MDEARHLVLIGMMGVGKSSVGRRIALRLGRPFVDTDKLVEERAGKSVPEIFAEDGEPAFRVLESEAVRNSLDPETWAVIAFGGGAVLDPANRDRARDASLVVWLQAPPWELARRVSASQRRSGGVARPLLVAGSPEATLEAIAAEREDSYRATAHVLIDTTGRSPSQVATAVLRATGWDVPL
ncbi:MAG TPA: shikimate kinase [Acidimicrobiia bacterium]|jgi:shikimate kinase